MLDYSFIYLTIAPILATDWLPETPWLLLSTKELVSKCSDEARMTGNKMLARRHLKTVLQERK